ncbi:MULTISPECIES: aspartyl protease family protein [Stenotrophomonas]|uniref:aspartyl protease family protein n=1 Tax=Stenotrophomonas TaxID=40323 RepID=UPI00066E30F5|nr:MULTISPECIES: aspartyl protease family protein [Stenotrophomonas]MDJ1520612.1 aspartyl protease family protein [Stenotrophomonas maltophilia]MCR1803892.1 pepsin/retropepsin-like aspartic protease family protein [Stenotrophomonas geniculata]MDH0187169.1 pepsin/retropepsin-like aspartic protease family protein [Stenotrophomonas sp. GD04051]MDH0462944.1 pepsin/retropepsin-like aspartic protease family protein [Stenotrophomonas sp. GD03993]MDH0875854.1 pepsin/retropepsin-like aspartic protease 
MRLTLLPLFAAAFPTLAADTPEHVLPMWMQGGHPTVALSLDGQAEPLRFVVDSAAGATLIDGRVARRYGLVDGKADVSTAQGASASGAQLRRTRTTTWQLGSWQLRASALQADLGSLSGGDDPAIDGLVGNDLTARWDTRWDFARGELSLSRTGTLRFDDDSCQANALQDRTEGLRDFGFITLTLDGTNVAAVAVVDTGAAQTVLNNAAAHALGLRTDGSDPRLRKRSKGTEGLGGKPHPTWLYTLPGMRSTAWQHPAMEVRISELPVFKAIGLDTRPALILGADAMRGGQVDISTGAARICLRRQAAT